MYINVTFILYIIAILISLVCLVFIGLIFVRKNDRSNATYIAVRRFSVTVLLTDLLYFLFYYREIVHQEYELTLPYRLTDYTLCAVIFLFWILVMGHMMTPGKHRKIIQAGVVLSVVRLIASLIATSAFMGVYYDIDNPMIRQVWTITEMCFTLLTAIIIIYCSIRIITETISRLRRQYVVLCSALLLFWDMVQSIVNIRLFAGQYGVSAWSMETPDFTGATMFLLNLSTCIFVFKEDFSPLFFSSSQAAFTDISQKLDAIASSHKLTVREREVMELMYKGYTNPDIGEELFITINTVKKHTLNIFEKLDVSNRMEVVHLINSWKNPDQ